MKSALSGCLRRKQNIERQETEVQELLNEGTQPFEPVLQRNLHGIFRDSPPVSSSMVLKDKKVGALKRTAKADNEGALILSNIESPHASNVLPSLKSYLAPVCKLKTSSGKENADKHQVAKQFVPFLAQVLKLCSNRLSNLPASDEVDAKVKVDELFSSMEFALDCFEHLREWLVGSAFEVEMQRSWLVRRYIASRRFHEALDQGLQLLNSLCTRIVNSDKAVSNRMEGATKKSYKFELPHPDHAKNLSQTVVILIVGAATDFFLCAAEIGLKELPLFEKVIVTAQELEPWLSKLEPDKAEKQRSLIFRELNKCMMAIFSDRSRMQIDFVESLSSLTLHQCALSSMNNHFCKIARNICSRLSSQGLGSPDLAVKLCEGALSRLSELDQLQGIRGTQEMLELIECYARLCQTVKRNFIGWKHIQRATSKHTEDSSTMAVAGLYAVGLILSCGLSETNCQQDAMSEMCSTLSTDSMLEQSVCCVLKDAIKAGQKFLVCFSKDTGLESAVAGSEEINVANKRDNKSFVNLYRALDFFRRSAFTYAQIQWDTFIARNQDCYMPQELLGTLRHCLLLFCEMLNAGLGCGSLTPDELELFKKGSRSFFLAANAALKLSLVRQDEDKESAILISKFLGASFVGQEELKWLLSSSYNMGVQLFNMKLHERACEPFRISYLAAWERVSLCDFKWDSDDLKSSDAESTVSADLVADACAKSNVLFDTLNRNSLSHEAFEVFCESMIRWARTGLVGVKRHTPHTLLQLWLKKVFAMKLIKERVGEEGLICSFVLQSHPPLPTDAVGLLLEEELLLYDNMEESDSSTLKKKRRLLDLLLDKVYTTDAFFVQHARVLREKGKLCRLDSVEGYNSCLTYLTQAIDILTKDMNAWDDYSVVMHTKLHLAMDYFLRACCLQEINPSKNDFLEDVLNGSSLCDDLFTSKPFLDEHFLVQLPAVTSLLENVADLLAFKGYSSLLYRINGLLMDIASTTRADPEDAFTRIFLDRKLSHLFCCSPFLHALTSLAEQKLGLDLHSKEFLQNLVRKSSDGVLCGFLCEMLNGGGLDEDLATSRWTEMSHTADDSKTNDRIFKASQALFNLAERRRESGNLEEAFRNAKEALRFRLKLLNRSFNISTRKPLVMDFKDEPSETSQKLIYFDALGCLAVRNWPDMKVTKRSEVGPSQWQILGDYLESLMQVGVLSEMLGLIDDADSSFQEGCQIAKSQGLPFAEGLFQSCLGETQRKRHLWEHAKRSYEVAAHLFNQCVIESACEHCMELARASLDFRIADLRRHQTFEDSMEGPKLALEAYINVENRLLRFVADIMKGMSNTDVVEDGEPSRNQLRSTARSGNSCSKKSLTAAEKNSSKHSWESKAQIHLPNMPEARLASEIVNEHTIVENRYRTRRKAAAKPGDHVVLPDNMVDVLCVEARTKLNVQKPRIHSSGKGQPTTRRGKKSSTRKKCLVQGLADEVNTECSSALSEVTSTAKVVTEGAQCLEQIIQNSGSGRPCLLHKTCKILEEQFSLGMWIDNQWISRAKRLLARLLLQKGKCLIDVASFHEVHIQFYRALGVLRDGDWSILESSCSSSLCGLECLVAGVSKSFRVEEGCLFYHMSLLALRQETCEDSSNHCCLFESADVSTVLKWLCHAFLSCREMPSLLCKVARIIAILHVPKDLGGLFDCVHKEGLQSRGTAPYFHQLSIGATTRQQHISSLDVRKTEKSKMANLFYAGEVVEKMQEALRVGPSTLNTLHAVIEEEVDVPCPTVCLSLVDYEIRYLHSDLEEVPTESWLLVSRFDPDSGPLSMILPCASLPKRFGASQCPYNFGVEDEALPTLQFEVKTAFETFATDFKSILDESRQSTSGGLSLDSTEEKSRWWEWRMDLDARLASLLRAVEEMWLGPWKSLLLGKHSVKSLAAWRSSAESFKRQLESITKAGPFNVDVIQLLLQGAGSLSRGELERGFVCLLDWKLSSQSRKSVLSKVSMDATFKSKCGELVTTAVDAFIESFQTAVTGLPATSLNETNSLLSCLKQKNLFNSKEEVEVSQEPVVLVLDGHLQALPWESLPVLRKKEVYRVPSLGSMKALMIQRYFLEPLARRKDKSEDGDRKHEEQQDTASSIPSFLAATAFELSLPATSVVPTIDPCNTYFLLNPSGDLGSTQAAFEDMFRCQQGWEGKIGQVPSVEEYMEGLQRHELFVYFGHGSGDQYLPERRMRKMDRCAAALLMGCSSGHLSPRGDYEPVGVPLWYLMAGCPTAIANLWDVTDGDIDRFSRVLLENWLETGHKDDLSSNVKDPIQSHCQTGRKRGQKLCKSVKSFITPPLTIVDERMYRAITTASHIGEGRNSCRLPNLIGASPVCYGIPTLVKRQSSKSS